jgi:hypothetical protein
MAFKALLIIVVIAILMDDSSSIRKKSEEEEKEDEKIAELVNATLAEEEKKRKEEEDKKKKVRSPDEKKKKMVKEEEDKDPVKEKGNKDKACSPCQECPEPKVCPEEKLCPAPKECPEGKECPPCKRCPDPEDCPPVECPPVLPCPVDNGTRRGQELPTPPSCPELPSMTVPVAMLVGAAATVLFTGVAASLGLLLRYASPLESGFIFLATIIIVWYLCSHYPETAREIGGRAATLLREAAAALSHRVMAALQRHQDQVGFSAKPSLFFRMSSMFYFSKSLHLRFSM